jgi:hypothetical protein
MLAERGLDVSYETVRRWFLKFGSTIAANLRRTRCRAQKSDPACHAASSYTWCSRPSTGLAKIFLPL